MSFDLLIRDVAVLRVRGPAEIAIERDRDVAIEGERIAAIEPAGTISPGRAPKVIEAAGCLATPGLLNCHSHVPMVLFRGTAEDVSIERWFNDYVWPMESNLTEEDVYWGALLGIAELIESGVTAFADHYFQMHRVAQAVEEAGLRANLAWGFFEGTPGAEQVMERTLAFAQEWDGAGGGRIRTSAGPHAPYTCGPEFLAKAARRAHELGLPIHIHVSETREQVEASVARYGRTPVGMLEQAGVLEGPALLAHGAHPTAEDIELIARSGARVAHCPKTFLKMSLGVAPVTAMREAGIPVGLGTDGVVSNNTLDILEALRLAALAQKHLLGDPRRFTLAEALGMCFHDGARAFGQPELGDLRPGSPADLCLISTAGAHMQPGHDPAADLIYSARASDVDTVICAGRLLMRGRRLLTLDKERIVAEVRARKERLVRRPLERRIATYEP